MSSQKPYSYKHPHPAVTVDLVIFTLKDDALHVLLIERGLEPFQGEWALPGGFVRIKESLEVAAKRELQEETGLSEAYLEQVGAYGRPDRDPRERVISIAYFAIISADGVGLQAGSDARRVAWRSSRNLPPLAFDHQEIIDAARIKLSEKMNRTTIALEFLPQEFTLTELQKVYEAVRGETIDKRNFRKWAESLSFIKATGKKRMGGQHRPAALFKANTKGLVLIQSTFSETNLSSVALERKAEAAAAYQKGYEDAVAALHRAVGDSGKALLKSVSRR
jgi:ADP-ribose pyrophosphatase YjhB (NUDIX family)